MAHVTIGSARIDENTQAHGGKAGDQNGHEVATQQWYLHKQGYWRVFRPKNSYKAKMIASNMRMACDNPYIGYDQWQRDTLYNEAKKCSFNCSMVRKEVECDCSSLVRVCLAYAGIMVDTFRTYNEPEVLLKTGEFTELKGDDYQKREVYLKLGDILCTPASGHTVVVLSNGDLAYATPPTSEVMDEDMETLKVNSRGSQVRTLQRLLNAIIGTNLVVDGDFGPATKSAVITYQNSRKLEADGVVGPMTWKRLLKGE